MEIYCRTCGHHEDLSRPLRPDEGCPVCDAGLWKRTGPPPSPATHFSSLLRAFVSLRGALFLAVFAVLAAIPIWYAQRFAMLLLYVGALKLAMRAMHVKDDEIEFPEIDIGELLDFSAFVPVFVYVLLFVFVPSVAFGIAFSSEPDEPTPAHAEARFVEEAPAFEGAEEPSPFDDEMGEASDEPSDEPSIGSEQQADVANVPDLPSGKREAEASGGVRGVALLVGLLALWFAPMALVLYLKAGTTWAMFAVPTGVQLMLTDKKGYLSLVGLWAAAGAAYVGIHELLASIPFVVALPLTAMQGALVLTIYGLCGLYVRSRARGLGVPVDDDDWQLIPRRLAPSPEQAPPRPRPAYVSLGPEDDDAPSVVVGKLLE